MPARPSRLQFVLAIGLAGAAVARNLIGCAPENGRCRSIRVPSQGANDVRTVFWRTTGRDSQAGARPMRSGSDCSRDRPDV